ncbi:BamA/TamA family outer membrane protein [Maribellus sediminis]|uniref:BamA/TamA family outer membrane protein n=1 Tax=Maribellus sediminis TaxID=2696285 RepID=UPI00142F75CD|nr:BamA/TamA family outer membrane protein [Maribellus sediminis]
MKLKLLLTVFVILYGILAHGQEQDSTKKVNLAAIPFVNYSKTLGTTFGAMTQGFYKVNRNDTVSPSSSSGLMGLYTTNKSYFFAAFQRLYLNEDRWRILAAVGFGNFNYQYWQDLPLIGGTFIDFGTGAKFAFTRVERQIYKELYGGVSGVISKTVTDFDLPDFVPDSIKADKRSMNNLGLILNYDKREHQMNPYGGYNIEIKDEFYREWLNSGNNFEKLELTYNHYYMLKNERNILATRMKAIVATGDVPFQGQSVVGHDDIRGYSNGKYRDNQVYAVQAEYRWRFYKKFGMVGFAGVASAVKQFGDIFSSEVLPGAGVGLRYLMIEKERINIGIDVAKGKDDWGLYFRIGESFGR